jgi:hypothetical protein
MLLDLLRTAVEVVWMAYGPLLPGNETDDGEGDSTDSIDVLAAES